MRPVLCYGHPLCDRPAFKEIPRPRSRQTCFAHLLYSSAAAQHDPSTLKHVVTENPGSVTISFIVLAHMAFSEWRVVVFMNKIKI